LRRIHIALTTNATNLAAIAGLFSNLTSAVDITLSLGTTKTITSLAGLVSVFTPSLTKLSRVMLFSFSIIYGVKNLIELLPVATALGNVRICSFTIGSELTSYEGIQGLTAAMPSMNMFALNLV
jgi:hypothetical protein